MSGGTIKSGNLQVGQDGTASNNFTWYQPAVADGTVRLGVGVAGATTSDVMTANNSGNVGIGTTSPSYKLQVYGASNPEMRLGDAVVTYQLYTEGATAAVMGTVGSHALVYRTNATERMRIDSSGNVGIGTSSPTYKLDISSGSSNTLNITTNNTNTTIFNITRTSVTTVTHTLDSTGYKIINGGSGGLYLGYTGTSWTSLSDERFKTDLKPIQNAVEKVSTLRAVTGRFKTDDEDKSRAFLIAQDIQAVLPEAVDTSNPEQLGVSYTDTIPLLVAAIKEQQTIINDLTARITALEGAN